MRSPDPTGHRSWGAVFGGFGSFLGPFGVRAGAKRTRPPPYSGPPRRSAGGTRAFRGEGGPRGRLRSQDPPRGPRSPDGTFQFGFIPPLRCWVRPVSGLAASRSGPGPPPSRSGNAEGHCEGGTHVPGQRGTTEMVIGGPKARAGRHRTPAPTPIPVGSLGLVAGVSSAHPPSS